MQGKTKQGFVLSILLHAGVIVGMVLFTLFKPREKPKEMVFELVASSGAAPMEAIEETVRDFSSPTPPIPVPPRVEPPPPKPKPPEVKPKPVETKPKPVSKPPPKPVETKPKPPPMTLEEFRKAHPEKQKPKTPAPPKPVKPPRVDTRFVPNLRDTVVNVDSLSGLSQIQQSELQNYIARLREALKLCWAKPASGGMSLATEVEFTIVPAGTFARIRVSRGSGNGEFDASVLEAFDSLGRAGNTPEGKPLNLRLTFKINED
jgi:TonB family protein